MNIENLNSFHLNRVHKIIIGAILNVLSYM
jgi:hypothetical protein